MGKVVELLVSEGLVNLKEVNTDGTKIESKANRYTFVWGKSIKLNKERIKKQLEEFWDYTQQIAKEELQDTSPTTFEQIDSEKVTDTIKKTNKALKDKPVSKKVNQKLKYAAKYWPEALDRYKDQEDNDKKHPFGADKLYLPATRLRGVRVVPCGECVMKNLTIGSLK